MNGSLCKVLKRLHYPIEAMFGVVRWYPAHPLSLHIEEMMAGRRVFVDHTTVHRWSIKMRPILAAVMRRRKRRVRLSWRMDETCVRVCREAVRLSGPLNGGQLTTMLGLRLLLQQDRRSV